MMAKPGTVRVNVPGWAGISLALLALGCGAVLFLVDPAHCPFYPQCLFHRMTGWNCPGCGSLRAMHQLLHGHFFLALRCNAPLMLAVPVVAVYAARQLARWRAGGLVAIPELRPRHIFAILAALAVFTVVRNIPCSPFIYLSPP